MKGVLQRIYLLEDVLKVYAILPIILRLVIKIKYLFTLNFTYYLTNNLHLG